MYDAVIIGAGVIGCAIARELSFYEGSICVLEKASDVCEGTSKANSGIVHAGFDAKEGSVKARMNVEGNRRMQALTQELQVPFVQNGSLVVCTEKADRERLQELLERGERNGVSGLRILEGEALFQEEPNLDQEVKAALYAPTGGIVCPYSLTIALAENAAENGAAFQLDTAVTGICKKQEGYEVKTTRGSLFARAVINAAGVHADEIHRMLSKTPMEIQGRRGEYLLLDAMTGKHVAHTIFQLPGKEGKGVLVTPTTHGNLLLGPTADFVEDKEDVSTTAEGLLRVQEKASVSVRKISFSQVITTFSGVRAHEKGGDFLLGPCPDAEGFFEAAGIESPGLTAAPAIGALLAEQTAGYLGLAKKARPIRTRKAILNPKELSIEEQNRLIQEKPAYGRMICRCEQITEGEILDAIHRPLGARTIDGVKRRTRAGMGRCQGGFCMPKVAEILAREWQLPAEQVTKAGIGSELLTGEFYEKGGEAE